MPSLNVRIDASTLRFALLGRRAPAYVVAADSQFPL